MQKKSLVLINVPHASTYIPRIELRYFTTPFLFRELAVMTDHYCDDLYATGDTMLCHGVSRLVCDPERFRDDKEEIMVQKGMGAIYIRCSDETELKNITPKHKKHLLRRYYDSYHRKFEQLVTKKLKRYGKCLIVDGHSFYPTPLPYEIDQNAGRPDLCIGTDDFHTPQALAECLYGYFESRGYSVAYNTPFSGCIVPLKYYRKDCNVMSIMIEINRRLYLDDYQKKGEGYNRIKKDIAEAIIRLGEIALKM